MCFITILVSSFIGLAYEGISSFLHHRCNRALHKAISAMHNKANIQCNKLMQLENSMLMYGIYNVETLEKSINTVHTYTTQPPCMRDYLQDSTVPMHLDYFMHFLQAHSITL